MTFYQVFSEWPFILQMSQNMLQLWFFLNLGLLFVLEYMTTL